MMSAGYNINDLVQEAQTRWLKPAEVLFILQTHEESQITHEPPQKPASGSLFLFNKRVLRFFRKDGHSWRRKKDGRTVGEAHERLKVGYVEALNCYYAHGEQNPNFQRRSYWMLDQGHDHIVLVHYRDISIGKHNAGSLSLLSPGSSSVVQSPCSNTSSRPATAAVVSEPLESYESTFSPSSIEVNSDVAIKGNGTSYFDGTEFAVKTDGSPELEINQALRRLEEQLSLNDENLKDVGPFYIENDNSYDLDYDLCEQSFSTTEMQDGSNNHGLQQYAGDKKEVHQYHQQLKDEFTTVRNDTLHWTEIVDYGGTSQGVTAHEKFSYTSDGNVVALPPSRLQSVEEQVKYHSQNIDANTLFPQLTHGINPDYYPTLYDQGQIAIPLEADSSLTIAREQKFTICEISPEWGYASEATKVIIIGSFHCDPSTSTWACMFGDIEVPIEILQEGVLRCRAPPRAPGKSTLCITLGNRESCSEVREFEYRVQPSAYVHGNLSEAGAGRTSDELLLLVRFVQTLLSGQLKQNGESTEPGFDFLRNFKAGEDSWSQVIEALLFGSMTSFSTTDWLLEELLKDKLQQWLSAHSHDEKDPQHCSSKRDQGLIHMVSGLGFAWALTPILNSGVSVNFRDINGWTALHWAARFGREKMVAELLAAEASAGAVTDPNAQEPTGKTPASIAATFGHKGLAGYLSEVALTTHLSSLTLEESELSRGSAEVEAERTVNTISNTNFVINEDQLSLKDTLAAVRNATQAAARIQSAFRAHSFRRRQRKESVAYASGDEFDILFPVAFRSIRDNNAALSIQKKYRGWKGRKDFLAFRQKVVKIQAHVRGHQVRKNYKVICWATGILEKVVLRWRRKGVGLRGFKQEFETIEDSEDEDVEDVVKVFRKQKVNVAIDEAVSRVLSMVESQEARQQYRRMLERFRQAKAERVALENEAASTSQSQNTNMENDGTYTLPNADASQYLWLDA